tara:strand:+ start:577 stop:1026 length:450 start_codon:yes stop_codon:yes gene_type:complete
MDTFDTLDENNEFVKPLLEHARNWLGGKKLTTFNLVELSTSLIPKCQRIMSEPGLGPMKKKVILSVLHILVEKLKFGSDEEKHSIQLILNETIPTTIDLMIDISKGKLDLEKIVQSGVLQKCFGSCLKPKKKKSNNSSSTSSASKVSGV